MKNLVNAFLTTAAIRSVGSEKTLGKTLVVTDFPEKWDNTIFESKYSKLLGNEDLVTYLPEINSLLEVNKNLKDHTSFVWHSHGLTGVDLPLLDVETLEEMKYSGRYNPSYVDIIGNINSESLKQLHFAACHIGQNVNSLFDPQSDYYNELNKSLKNGQRLFLHGDEYTGLIASSFSDRLPHLVENEKYSISEALLDSREGLNVVFKKDDKLNVFVAKSFGRNGEEWTIDNYRNYLQQVFAEAEDFEKKNGIFNGKTPDIKEISDEKIGELMSNDFFRYFIKILDTKDSDKVLDMISKLPNLDFQSKSSNTALKVALDRDHIDIAKAMIEKMTEFQGESANSFLKQAFDRDHFNIVKILTKKGAKPDFLDEKDSLVFADAIEREDYDTAKILMSKNKKIEEDFDYTVPHIPHRVSNEEMENFAEQNEDYDNPDLISAIKHYDVEKAKDFIEQNVDLDAKDINGQTALMHSIFNRQFDVAKTLISKGCKLDIQDNVGENALMILIRRLNFDLVKTLIDKGTDLDVKNIVGDSAFIINAKIPDSSVGNYKKDVIARKLAEKGVDVDAKDNEGRSALIYATSRGELNFVNTLIELGVNLNLRDDNSWTALMCAIIEDKPDIAKSLIEKGANINIENKSCDTALTLALEKKNFNLAKLLVDNGAEIDFFNRSGRTLLGISMEENNIDVIDFLVTSGADASLVKDEKLQEFFSSKNLEEDPKRYELFPKVLLNLAKNGKLKEVKSLIEEKLPIQGLKRNLRKEKEKFDFLDVQDEGGNTLLMYAANQGDEKLASLLLENGADINLKNKEGESSYRLAKKNRQESIVNLIENEHRKNSHEESGNGVKIGAAIAVATVISGAIAAKFMEKSKKNEKEL